MSDTQTRPLLVLVDGHAVAYRAYFALQSSNFQTSQGEPTNAIYGFTRLIFDILAQDPTYFAISFDRGMSGREKLYADYKGTREKMPDDLAVQLERIDKLIKAFNIPVLAVDGYEADDVIGTVTQQAEAAGCDVRIVTGDRDILQLLSEHTRVQLPQRGGDDKLYSTPDFIEKYPGLVSPYQLPDLKGIMGDSSDNIPGVKGLGEKGALNLLKIYGSLENIYANLDSITGATKTKLEVGREMAFLSKDLATIKRDVPIQLNLAACISRDFDPIVVDEIFQELEFRTFRQRLQKLTQDDPLLQAKEAEVSGEAPQVETIVVDTVDKLNALTEALNAATVIAFDTETTGVDQMSCHLVGIALAVEAARGYYIPVGHISPNAPDGTPEGILPSGQADTSSSATVQFSLLDDAPPSQLPLKQVLDAIRPALTNPTIGKIAHNAKYDFVVMQRYGIDVHPITFDTMLAEWLVKPDESSRLGLKPLALARLNIHMTEIDELLGKGRKKISMARVPVDHAAAYAVVDAAVLFSLKAQLESELDSNPTARHLFNTMEMPLMPVIADMEMKGVLLNLPYLQDLSGELGQRLHHLENEIYRVSHQAPFNINSLNQLSDVLFNKLNIPPQGLKKTKTGNYSLTADVLESMQNVHEIIPLLQNYRQLTKLKSTYVDAIPALVNKLTGRVHTSFNQTGASTGRFSSSDPNLQNIPIRTEEGRRVRRAFIAPPDHQLLSVDYSQIELRILAHYSGDQALIDAFEQNQDIHASTAAAVHRISLDEVTFEQRSFAKSVNFGLMYGMGAFRLARDSALTYAEAQEFIRVYFERFPGVKKYLDESKRFAEKHGYVQTLLGRSRNFPILTNPNASAVMKQRAEREAINMPIQGTAADIIKIAMVNLAPLLKNQGYASRMLLQVHDELVLEVPNAELESVAPLVVSTMESAVSLSVPVKAEAKAGLNWQEMKPLTL